MNSNIPLSLATWRKLPVLKKMKKFAEILFKYVVRLSLEYYYFFFFLVLLVDYIQHGINFLAPQYNLAIVPS